MPFIGFDYAAPNPETASTYNKGTAYFFFKALISATGFIVPLGVSFWYHRNHFRLEFPDSLFNQIKIGKGLVESESDRPLPHNR